MKYRWIAAATMVVGMWGAVAQAEFEHVESYICHAEKMRTPGFQQDVDSRIEFRLYKDATGRYQMEKLVGHLQFGERDEKGRMDGYYGVFSFEEKLNDPDYSPRVYTNHIQFDDFDAFATSFHDGGGIWGNFVVNKSGAKKIDAHYIMQAGDHAGGTVDYTCEARW